MPSYFQQAVNSEAVSLLGGNLTNDTVTPVTTGLGATLVSGRTYSGTLVLYVSNSTAADGFRMDFDGGTCTATAFQAMGTIADTVSVRPLAAVTSLSTDLVDATTTGSSIVTVSFTITVNAGGTLIPRFAMEADSGGTITLSRGSNLTLI